MLKMETQRSPWPTKCESQGGQGICFETDVYDSVRIELVDPKLTKHLHEERRWKDCTRLFFHDLKNILSKSRIMIEGCRASLYLYQAFGIFVMLEMEMFQGGGYNANDMGLRKVHEMYPW